MIRLWYDQNGALLGTPWKVQIEDSEPGFYSSVEFNGQTRTLYRVNEAPHGLVVLLEGAYELRRGKELVCGYTTTPKPHVRPTDDTV